MYPFMHGLNAWTAKPSTLPQTRGQRRTRRAPQDRPAWRCV